MTPIDAINNIGVKQGDIVCTNDDKIGKISQMGISTFAIKIDGVTREYFYTGKPFASSNKNYLDIQYKLTKEEYPEYFL